MRETNYGFNLDDIQFLNDSFKGVNEDILDRLVNILNQNKEYEIR